jgi:ribulose-phosphate 3-epimerase
MSSILPSILEDTPELFQNKLAEVLKISEIHRIQIDFSDGKFTPRKTFSIADLDSLNPAYFWEAHLMVENPNEHFLDAKIAGFNALIFHYEAVKDPQKIKSYAAELRSFKLSPGLAINSETDPGQISEFLDIFDLILVMGVKPGYQGQQMLPDTADKISKLKKVSKNVKIEVDGGVKISNIRQMAEAGADFLNVGSALFDRGEKGELTPLHNFENLQAQINFKATEIKT